MFHPTRSIATRLLVAAMLAACSARAEAQVPAAVPTLPGQAAYGAIGEVVRILEADPATDWSQVNIEALRQHLIDMDEVTLRSRVAQHDVPGGFEAEVTGTGFTVGAIKRMMSNHAAMLDMSPDYHATAVAIASGVRFVVTARNSSDGRLVARLRGLGFAGLLTEGSHHPVHHLALARGAAGAHGHE